MQDPVTPKNSHRTCAIYALTQKGAMLGAKLACERSADLFVPASLGYLEETIPFTSLRELVAETYHKYRQHIFVAAVGIVVRCIAPHIRDKSHDPAVVALDQRGNFVISVLSGHLGKANQLTQEIAQCLDATPVITTATDTESLPSLDVLAMDMGLSISNIKAVTTVNAALLAGRPIILNDPHNLLRLKNSAWEALFICQDDPCLAPEALREAEAAEAPRISVTCRLGMQDPAHLVLHPKMLHLGIGCRRAVRAEPILEFIHDVLAQLELSPTSIAGFASATIKQQELGLLQAAKELGITPAFFTPEQLSQMPVTSPSPKAQEVLGIDGVCEAAALLSAGKNAKLILPKQVHRGITLAIAEGIPLGV